MTFRSTFLAALVSASFAAAGCGGEFIGDPGDNGNPDPGPGDTTPPPQGEDPRPFFKDAVAPTLQASCATEACHASETKLTPIQFVRPDADAMYDIIVGYEDRMVGYFDATAAPMLTRIIPGPHYTASYTAEQAQAIRDWLAAELEFRTGGVTPPTGGEDPPPTPGQISKQLISEWSGCMDLATWDEEGVAAAWANKGSGEGVCASCHSIGNAGFIATVNSQLMFDVLSTRSEYMVKWFAPDVISDPANPKMIINRELLVRVGRGEDPYREHPNFNVDGDAYDRLERFYNRTMERKQLGLCDAPRIQ